MGLQGCCHRYCCLPRSDRFPRYCCSWSPWCWIWRCCHWCSCWCWIWLCYPSCHLCPYLLQCPSQDLQQGSRLHPKEGYQDCTETVSTTCTQQSTQQSHSSAVVGADTRVGPEAVVAHHGTIAVAAHAHVAGPVVAGGVVAAGYGAGYGAGLVGGVVGHAGPVVAGY